MDALHMLALAASILVLWVVVFASREDERKRELALKQAAKSVRKARAKAKEGERRVLVRVANSIEQMAAKVSGGKWLSAQGIGVLLCLSLGSIGTGALALSAVPGIAASQLGLWVTFPEPSIVWLRGWVLAFLTLAASPMFLRSALWERLWGVMVLLASIGGGVLFHEQAHAWLALGYLCAALLLGMLSDAIVIQVAVRGARTLRTSPTWWRFLLGLILGIGLAVGLGAGPWAMFRSGLQGGGPSLAVLGLLLALANTQTALALGAAIFAVLLILIHQTVWPLLQRPIDSFDRHKVLTRHRRWWLALGALLMLWSLGIDVEWIKSLILP